MAFYDNYVRLCAGRNISPSAAALAIGIKKSNVTYWKNGRNKPSDVTLTKIADYFGVTVADLTGETDETGIKKEPATFDDRLNPDYLKLNAANRAAIDAAIAALLASQQSKD